MHSVYSLYTFIVFLLLVSKKVFVHKFSLMMVNVTPKHVGEVQ
jgi:hypothetical protein